MTTESEEKTTSIWLKEAQKGYIRMGVLILLNKKPAHGYELMKEINNRTRGFWQPTAGGVYPILQDLEKSGYIIGAWQTQKNRKLKVYRITESGDLILRRAIIKQAEISDNIGVLFREFAKDVLNMEPADASLMQVPSLFSPFLEDKARGKETLKKLEHDRNHMLKAIEDIKERLETIDQVIEKIKKQPKKEGHAHKNSGKPIA